MSAGARAARLVHSCRRSRSARRYTRRPGRRTRRRYSCRSRCRTPVVAGRAVRSRDFHCTHRTWGRTRRRTWQASVASQVLGSAARRTGLAGVRLGAGVVVVAGDAVVYRLDHALVRLRVVHGLQARVELVSRTLCRCPHRCRPGRSPRRSADRCRRSDAVGLAARAHSDSRNS